MNFINNLENAGGLFMRGERAKKMYDIQRMLETTFSNLKFEYLWLPSLSNEKHFHPQNIESSHRDGSLVHAACLPFFDKEEKYLNEKFFGVNRVHRLEPLRHSKSESRLECFNVFEIIITGDKVFVDNEYIRVKKVIDNFIKSYLNIECNWILADDSFMSLNQEKEELIIKSSEIQFSVCSGNKHGTFFSNQTNKYSCCFGIGIERLLLAQESIEKGG